MPCMAVPVHAAIAAAKLAHVIPRPRRSASRISRDSRGVAVSIRRLLLLSPRAYGRDTRNDAAATLLALRVYFVPGSEMRRLLGL